MKLMRPDGAERLVMQVPGIVLVKPDIERYEFVDDDNSIFVFQRYISEQVAVWEKMYPIGPDGARPNQYVTDILTHCLYTWKDVTYDDGEVVPFDKGLLKWTNETTRKQLIDIFRASTPPGVSPFVSVIEYRRLPPHEEDRLISKHSDQGILDSRAMGADLLEYCITGWNKVVDWDGNQVEFNADHLRFLPQDARNRMGRPLRAASGIPAAKREELLKNSETGLSASTSTDASPVPTADVSA